mgnify:CR=1 FL=1
MNQRRVCAEIKEECNRSVSLMEGKSERTDWQPGLDAGQEKGRIRPPAQGEAFAAVNLYRQPLPHDRVRAPVKILPVT